eukprot:8821209-Pyramimonas_sp.AAC.1
MPWSNVSRPISVGIVPDMSFMCQLLFIEGRTRSEGDISTHRSESSTMMEGLSNFCRDRAPQPAGIAHFPARKEVDKKSGATMKGTYQPTAIRIRAKSHDVPMRLFTNEAPCLGHRHQQTGK